MAFISGPFLAISDFPSMDMANMEDYVRFAGMVISLSGLSLILFTTILSVDNSFVSLQEKHLNVRHEITETSSKREKQKLEYLLHDLQHLKPLTAMGLFDINLKISTAFITVR